MAEPVSLPSNLGPYRVLGIQGRGGMGVVYRAVHQTLAREVAIKALPAELTRDQQVRQRFAAEARAQAKLQHPHIVAVHDLLEVGGSAYLVMELFGSRSLEQLLAQQAGQGLPEPAALRLVGQILSALDYAHSQGIIHRDVKPANVLVAEDGTAKLTDFGIALLLGEERRTKTSQAVGTPVYMSPEQILRPQSLDHRTDIYSAGVVLFELLAGRPPFDAQSDYEIQRQHLEVPAEERMAALGGVRPAVRAALSKALSKAPAERFSSAAAFHRALLGEGGGLAEPPQRSKSAATARPPKKRRSRWQTAITVGEIAGLVLLAALSMWKVLGWWAGPSPSPGPSPVPPPVPVIQPAPPPVPAPVSPPGLSPPPVKRQPPEQPRPPRPDPDLAIRARTVAQLRANLSTGIAEAEQLLAAEQLDEARRKVQELVNRSHQHRSELVDEMAALALLGSRITEVEIARRTEEQRRTTQRQAWERRLDEIAALIAQQKYPEAKNLAELLGAEGSVPADVAQQARELGAQAEAALPRLWEGTKVETDATLVNPRRKKKTVLDNDDDDDEP